MNLNQVKLNKKEWEAIEVPCDKHEIEILKIIQNGYFNVNIKHNNALSILSFMKINKNHELYHHYFYDLYFKSKIDTLIKKYNFPPYKKKQKKKNYIKESR